MAENRRPQGRETYVSGKAQDLHRRGAGLGTGPVGSQQSNMRGSVPTGGQRPGVRAAVCIVRDYFTRMTTPLYSPAPRESTWVPEAVS